VLVASGVLGLVPSARAELTPAEIFVVYNRNVAASRDLAEYYVQRRGVPATQRIGLDLPEADQISRDAYVAKVRAPLRAWLRRQNLPDKIRCIVTVYGVPLRIGGTGTLPADKPALAEVLGELDVAVADLQRLCRDLEGFDGRPPAASEPVEKPDPPKVLARYQSLRDEAMAKLRKAPASQQAILTRRIAPLVQRGEGTEAITAAMQSNDPAGRQLIDALKAEGRKHRQRLGELVAGCPRGKDRAQTHKMLREGYGLRALVEHLQEDKADLEGSQTNAALDSELALLWREEYPLYRWVVNPLNWRVRHDKALAERFTPPPGEPVVMVCRLDGPTPAIVRRMIDDAIAVEREGLAGKVYIDARGIKAADSGYGEYDEDLRKLADLLKTRTDLPVVLDNAPALFQQGQCPDAALYCGWYSLGKYVDAFKWNRGSVAWHIASSEAVSLHDPQAQYWCKRMLDEGVAATLGPVAEPYLMSFPRPRDFFGLLLTGRYTLAEVYWNTCPVASWMQVLLGDPLYMPFAKHPRLKPQDVFPVEGLAPQTQEALGTSEQRAIMQQRTAGSP